MITEYQSVEEVFKFLTQLFPSFEKEFEEEDCEDMNYHRIFRELLYFYGKYLDSFSQKQLNIFAEFINKSVEQECGLENAIGTCFLEHLYQGKPTKALKPLLSKQAIKLLYA